VELVAVCDTSSLILNGLKKYNQVKKYGDCGKMFDSEQLYLVVIATPTRFYCPILKAALESKAHRFCEKPFIFKSLWKNDWRS
jgi:predicted dehydrogenase